MDAFVDGHERLKVLPHITVVHVQNAFQAGFTLLGHRNLQCLLPVLEGMTWNTSPTKHRSAFVLLESLLLPLLQLCTNGLLPAKMSLLAMLALHQENRFTIPNGYTIDQAAGYFCQKLRQMAAKIRDLVTNPFQWTVFARRLSEQELRVMLRYCRCLDADFQRDTEEQAGYFHFFCLSRFLSMFPFIYRCPFVSFHRSRQRTETITWRRPLLGQLRVLPLMPYRWCPGLPMPHMVPLLLTRYLSCIDVSLSTCPVLPVFFSCAGELHQDLVSRHWRQLHGQSLRPGS